MANCEPISPAPLRKCDITRRENSIKRRLRVCESCGAEFVEGKLSAEQRAKGHKARFCSNACRASSSRLYASAKEAKRAERLRHRDRLGLPPAWQPTEAACIACAGLFIARSANAKRCEPCRPGYPRAKLTKPCGACGELITGNAAKKFCSKCVRRRSAALFVKAHGATKKHRHRARRFKVEYQPISPAKLFDRDSWRCQICGIKTPKRLRGTLEPNAPEIDHRIPMALGGPHTWANVQCACRACNMVKGARLALGQLTLFPEPM